MQSILALALGLFAASAIAQGTTGLPDCAKTCINQKQNGAQTYGGCQSVDIQCICTQSNFIADLACCVSTACDAADQEQTIQFANGICGSYASALPTTATCASTASSTATMSASSSSGAAAGNSSMSMTMTMTGTMSMGSMTSSGAAASATTSAAAAADMLQVQGAGLFMGLVGLAAAL